MFRETIFNAILIGAGATAFLDLFSAARASLSGTIAPDYGLVGRWLGHMPRGWFFHEAIAKAAPVKGERLIGWTAHYGIGIAFAAILLAVWGAAWARHPTLIPALIVGIGSVAAPFLLMQPGMGRKSRAQSPHRTVAQRNDACGVRTGTLCGGLGCERTSRQLLTCAINGCCAWV